MKFVSFHFGALHKTQKHTLYVYKVHLYVLITSNVNTRGTQMCSRAQRTKKVSQSEEMASTLVGVYCCMRVRMFNIMFVWLGSF